MIAMSAAPRRSPAACAASRFFLRSALVGVRVCWAISVRSAPMSSRGGS